MKLLGLILTYWQRFLLICAIRGVKKQIRKLTKLREDLVYGGVINWRKLMEVDIELDGAKARLRRLELIKLDLL